MIKLEEKKDLSPYNTLRLKAAADYFAIISTEDQLKEALSLAREKKLPVFVLGGGSNILISQDIKALVLKNELKGIELVLETEDSVYLQAASGEIWSALVHHAVNQGWGGIENLFYVPGTVGAAPVQNIGAYGVELKDVFESLRAMDLETGEIKEFSLGDCQFGYRDSVFKNKAKDRYYILSIKLKLSKKPQLKLDYGDIRLKLEERRIETPSVKQVAEIIREIRDAKLPNPSVLANAGSFFKNPELATDFFEKLQIKFPEIKFFPGSKEGLIKIPAGWLIEQAGFKGKRYGDVGMYEKQALILVNYGEASAKDALDHIKRVQAEVENIFGIRIEPEVNII